MIAAVWIAYFLCGILVVVVLMKYAELPGGLAVPAIAMWPLMALIAGPTIYHEWPEIIRDIHALTPASRRNRRVQADYDECLRLIEYQPKPESYWQLKEIEWENEV